MYKFFLLIFVFIISLSSNANAYLDPGTGSSILQIILAFLAGVGAFFSVYWNRLKFFLKKIFKKKQKLENKNDDKDI